MDDDPNICGLFKALLERRGHTVLIAGNGQAGLDVAQRESPEIVLLDLNMPGMGGMEALDRFSKQFPDTPVIIASGTGNMTDAIEALRLGACDFLIKPLPQGSTLTHTVERNLERIRLVRLNKAVSQELELNHAKIREDEEAGRRVQAKLFPPRDLRLGAYRFQHQVIPSLALSGDFVDYFAIGDRFAAFYCADVSGHGVSSALVTVLLKSLMNKHRERQRDGLTHEILEPDQLLTMLNRELMQENLGKHLTLFYGVLDFESNSLRFAVGGHYPPPILFADGQTRLLEQKSMAIGLFPFAKFQTDSLPLPPAFRLVIFSDGALDALALPDADAKIQYLCELRTEAALHRFVAEIGVGKTLPDDLSLLTITRGDIA